MNDTMNETVREHREQSEHKEDDTTEKPHA
jgi:hypothetical protein